MSSPSCWVSACHCLPSGWGVTVPSGHLSREGQACRGPAELYKNTYVSTGGPVCTRVCVFVLYQSGSRQTMSAAADTSPFCQELSLNNQQLPVRTVVGAPDTLPRLPHWEIFDILVGSREGYLQLSVPSISHLIIYYTYFVSLKYRCAQLRTPCNVYFRLLKAQNFSSETKVQKCQNYSFTLFLVRKRLLKVLATLDVSVPYLFT